MKAVPQHRRSAEDERDRGEQTDIHGVLDAQCLDNRRGPEGNGRVATDDAEIHQRTQP